MVKMGGFGEMVVAVIAGIILLPFVIFGIGIFLVALSYLWPFVLVFLLIIGVAVLIGAACND
jgi:hypothetical protein